MTDPDFAKGASGPENQYAGLGLNLAYLGGARATASATSGSGTTGTSFPASPSDAQLYTYVADATNGVLWTFRYYSAGAYWAFVGGPPLTSEVATSQTTTSVTYAALATAGPSIVLPFAADYLVSLGAQISNVNQVDNYMSYDIGATGAVDADAVKLGPAGNTTAGEASVARQKLKAGLTAVTLTAKYRVSSANAGSFANRWLSVLPVKK